jgi:hypothetical protein
MPRVHWRPNNRERDYGLEGKVLLSDPEWAFPADLDVHRFFRARVDLRRQGE